MSNNHVHRLVACWEYGDSVLVVGKVGRRCSHPSNHRYIGIGALEMADEYAAHGKLGQLDDKGRLREVEASDW